MPRGATMAQRWLTRSRPAGGRLGLPLEPVLPSLALDRGDRRGPARRDRTGGRAGRGGPPARAPLRRPAPHRCRAPGARTGSRAATPASSCCGRRSPRSPIRLPRSSTPRAGRPRRRAPPYRTPRRGSRTSPRGARHGRRLRRARPCAPGPRGALAAGARPRRRELSGVDSLTPSELRVARLAAGGMTNREIAQSAVRDRQGGAVPPRQQLPQARNRRTRRACRRADIAGKPWAGGLVTSA